jgi:DNA-binding PadR family transcriptional regulator
MKPIVEPQNLSKVCNEALILAALSDGPLHGYQLALEIERRGRGGFRFNHGTLYPILHKLEKDGIIAGEWSADADGGRKRKQYVLTDRGRQYARELLDSWEEFIERFRDVTTGREK